MWNMDKIEDTRSMLKKQQIAIDYLRGVYTTVMYRRGGRTPVKKLQRFKIKTMQSVCEDVIVTYGSSFFPGMYV